MFACVRGGILKQAEDGVAVSEMKGMRIKTSSPEDVCPLSLSALQSIDGQRAVAIFKMLRSSVTRASSRFSRFISEACSEPSVVTRGDFAN